MIPHKKSQNQGSLFFSFESTLNHKHPLFILANKVNWQLFEDAFTPYIAQIMGVQVSLFGLWLGC